MFDVWYNIGLTLLYIAFALVNPLRVRGHENLPRGAAILCPNHTTLRDPVFVAMADGYRHHTWFMAKDELVRHPFVRWLFKILPVFTVRRDSGDIGAIKKSMQLLKQGHKLTIFPEGTRVHEGERVDAKAGAVMLAAKTGAPIVPVSITREPRLFRRVTVTFGEPIRVRVEDKSRASEIYHETAARLMREVYRLGGEQPRA